MVKTHTKMSATVSTAVGFVNRRITGEEGREMELTAANKSDNFGEQNSVLPQWGTTRAAVVLEQ